MLDVVDVHKTYPTRAGPLIVLRGVMIALQPGEAVAILGPSGSGKSTLLNILGTLESPTAGRVTLDGCDAFALSPVELARFRNERVGFVFQDHHLLPQCSVLENVLLPTLAGGPVRTTEERARELLARVGLTERETHRPAELSGGEKQRVALARALINAPRLVLADEPTGNLDRTTAEQVATLLGELPRAHDTILVVVTHSAALAERFTRRYELDRGVLRPVQRRLYNARMHICHVITRLIIGGAQENTILTCEGLRERGHRVTLVCGPTTGPEGSLVERARRGGYDYVEVPDLVRRVDPWHDWRARRALCALYRRLSPDVVHTHSSKAGILGRFAARDAGVPLVVHTIHGMSFNRTQPWVVRAGYAWLERLAAQRSDAIVTVAEAMIARSVAAGICPAAKMLTVYSGMEVAHFTPSAERRSAVRAEWGAADDDIVVGTVARLFRNKGYEQLLPIMAAAAEREPRLRFVWIGDGAQRGQYERDLQRLGLRGRSILTGLVAPVEIPRLLAGCDLLAHTSQWEGLPRAVVQALLLEVPAVAFDIDGTPEVVRDGRTGRLAPLNDQATFVTALCELAANEDLRQRMGSAGRAWCLERFDARRMVAALDGLYQRLASGAMRPGRDR